MVELAEVIRNLRRELAAAMLEGDGQDLRFEVGPVDLELSVSVEKQGGASGKVRFWVVELGADGKSGHTDTQRIKLTLQPRLAESGSTVLVSGDETDRER